MSTITDRQLRTIGNICLYLRCGYALGTPACLGLVWRTEGRIIAGTPRYPPHGVPWGVGTLRCLTTGLENVYVHIHTTPRDFHTVSVFVLRRSLSWRTAVSQRIYNFIWALVRNMAVWGIAGAHLIRTDTQFLFRYG